jgi:hypothetical protein
MDEVRGRVLEPLLDFLEGLFKLPDGFLLMTGGLVGGAMVAVGCVGGGFREEFYDPGADIIELR